jgi:hypothetical protein
MFFIQFLPSGVPTEQTNSSSRRREFRRSKPTLVLIVGSSDGANQLQFSSSGVPTGKPTLVLVVGSSDGANQLQFSSSGVPTGQTNSSSHRREFRQHKFFLLFLIRYSDGKKWYSFLHYIMILQFYIANHSSLRLQI